MRRIKTGSLQSDGRRVVEGDIKDDDWVVVGALPQIHPHMEVKRQAVPMPSLNGQAEAPPPANGAKGTEHRPECQVDPFCRKGLMCDELVKAPAFSSDAESQ